MTSVWTDELADRVLLLSEKFSAQEISNRLAVEGYDISRNAIISKLSRLGSSSAMRRVRRSIPLERTIVYPPVPPRNVPFIELEAGECQFECSPGDVATRDFVFCGNPVRDEECRFCGFHAQIAYKS
jgi:hypothetical protein